MPRKNVITPILIVNAVSMGASITQTTPTNIQFLDNIGVHFIFTGTPSGTFSIEVSNDDSNWAAITLPSTPTASGSGDNIYVDLNQLSAAWLRVKYTRSSGTGTLNVYLTAKEI